MEHPARDRPRAAAASDSAVARCRFLCLSGLPRHLDPATLEKLHAFLSQVGSVEDLRLEGGGTALVEMSCTREADEVRRQLPGAWPGVTGAFDDYRASELVSEAAIAQATEAAKAAKAVKTTETMMAVEVAISDSWEKFFT